MDEIDKKDHNCLHSATGIRKMRKSKGRERLDKRIENEMAFKNIVHIITFGLGVISTSVIKSASLYLVRDYPAVVDFVQDRKDYFGTIMVPEILIPGAPRIFDPHLSQSVLDQLSGGKDRKKFNKLKGELTRHKGYSCEDNLFNSLKQHYKGQNVLVINGLKMLKLNGKSGEDEQEIDIIIVDYDRQLIWNVESKKRLEFTKTRKQKHSSAGKAKIQLEKVRLIMEDYFDSELEGDWNFGSALYTEEPADEIKNCQECSKFIGFGANDFVAKLKSIEKKLDRPLTKIKTDMEILAKYLLYCCPKTPLPTSGNLNLQIKEAIKEQGSVENIHLHYFPTQEQLNAPDENKVAILGCWGAGKSSMLMHEAQRLAKNKIKVIFLVFISYLLSPFKRSYFIMDLEEKLKDYKEYLKVEAVHIKNGVTNNLIELTKGYDCVIIDEGLIDIDVLEENTKAEIYQLLNDKVRVWMTMSNFHSYGSTIPSDVKVEDKIKELLPPDFRLIKLTTPLRMSLKIAESIKNQYEEGMGIYDLNANEKLMAECNLPKMMVEGKPVEEIGAQKIESLFQNLEDSFSKLPEVPVLIIINDIENDPLNGIIKSIIGCSCSQRFYIMAITLVLRKIGRPCPLFHTIQHKSPELETKKWMNQLVLKDSIGSLQLVRGFESDHIIDLSGQIESISRAAVQFIQVYQNWLFVAYSMKEKFFVKGHDCNMVFDQITNGDLTGIDKEDFNISKLINESLNGYIISTTLPEPRHYNYSNDNPILAVLADQMREPGAISDENDLLRRVNVMFVEIITGLKNGTIAFPNNPKLLPMDTWIQNMESDMSCYRRFARDADEFKAFDDQMIQITANYLKSPITLISFPTGEPKVIHTMSETTSTKQFYILSCNTASWYSFAVSIYPEEKPSRSFFENMKQMAKSFLRK